MSKEGDGTFVGAALYLSIHTFFNHKNIGALEEVHVFNGEITLFSMKPTLKCLRIVLPDDAFVLGFHHQLSSGLCQNCIPVYGIGL